MKKIMKSKSFLLFASLIAAGAATNVVINHFELPIAKVTVKVVDENEVPIHKANVWLMFKDRLTAKQQDIRGLTDTHGFFTGEGGADVAGIGCGITKDGYYNSGAPVPKFTEIDEALNHWKPWNETCTVIMRPIGKPVALYAKKIQTQLPELDMPCGYDLEAGDWVMPYGKGMKKDLIFKIHKDVRGMQDYDAAGELTFANSNDGLLDVHKPVVAYSKFKWERLAPENGYESKLQLRKAWFPLGSGRKPIFSYKKETEWEGYFLRVRTVEQDGKIVSAYYGKIRGGIEIEPRETPNCTITFTYYFNPTPNDRNLEWDTKKNLFGGLTDMETPRDP